MRAESYFVAIAVGLAVSLSLIFVIKKNEAPQPRQISRYPAPSYVPPIAAPIVEPAQPARPTTPTPVFKNYPPLRSISNLGKTP